MKNINRGTLSVSVTSINDLLDKVGVVRGRFVRYRVVVRVGNV
jgi:hypothetical protein